MINFAVGRAPVFMVLVVILLLLTIHVSLKYLQSTALQALVTSTTTKSQISLYVITMAQVSQSIITPRWVSKLFNPLSFEVSSYMNRHVIWGVFLIFSYGRTNQDSLRTCLDARVLNRERYGAC